MPREQDPSERRPPRTFQGWQRTACLGGVALLALLALLLLITVILELTGGH
ncbi:MAG: hypothetical protein ACLQNU_09935 [Candidatus Dormibacteria bacterium]